MAKTANLAKAKERKNDEFYTQWVDIQKEVNATQDQLMADPVFRHIPESILYRDNQTRAEVDELLAKGVPALSGLAGSRKFRDEVPADNQDMNALKANFDWPRADDEEFQGWRHSDIKDVALPFVRPVFERILLETAQ